MSALLRPAMAMGIAMVKVKMVTCVCVLGTTMGRTVSLKTMMVILVCMIMCRIAMGMEHACMQVMDGTTARVRKAIRPHANVKSYTFGGIFVKLMSVRMEALAVGC